ncbi:hypothetical protein HYO65_gp162 [Tenacibaculum phage PTm1]|uniref:Uncharacterized protein n=2 Tax=Shirahamavirus PTm1 TaxID=2846435 RepID=A0A5S9HXL8_9CAUD|nr:hypothetical protein HYO65_gp162 [Tenacibaculum phage PTm1]BBI90554.1 hypothetical protein [Tenacibaculum phage PTm1]BBI90862.1 hypothetical protein [Tenacibaculum phage PTm5]
MFNLFKRNKTKGLKTNLLRKIRSHKFKYYPEDRLIIISDKNYNEVFRLEKITIPTNKRNYSFSGQLHGIIIYFDDYYDFMKYIYYYILCPNTDIFDIATSYSSTKKLHNVVHRLYHYNKYYKRVKKASIINNETPKRLWK